MTQIQDWDTEQVVEWVNSEYKDKPKRAAAFRKAIEENEYSGKELLECETVDDLADALEISKKILIKSLFTKIQAFKGKIIDDVVDEVVKAQPGAKSNFVETEQDLEALIQIFCDLFQIERGEDEKAQMPEQDDMIKNFIATVKHIAVSTKDFVKSLMGVNLRKSVTDEIINICFDYYNLLKRTTLRFGRYGSDIKELSQVMSEISHTFSLPSTVMGQIRGMDAKNQQEAIKKLRQLTCSKLKSSTKRFSDKLTDIDAKQIPALKEISKSWLKLNKRIVKLLSLLKDSKQECKQDSKPLGVLDATLQKLKNAAKYAAGFCMKWIAAPVAAIVVAGAGGAVSGGLAAAGLGVCVVGAPIAGVALLAGAALSAIGARHVAVNAAEALMNKGDSLMNQADRDANKLKKRQEQFAKTKENITQIQMMQSALERMAKISMVMGNVINLELVNYQKIKDHDPHKQLTAGGFSDIEAMCMNQAIMAKIHELGSTILSCTKYLNKSKENIELVESTCTKEMNSFYDNIQQPLIDMLTKDKRLMPKKLQAGQLK